MGERKAAVPSSFAEALGQPAKTRTPAPVERTSTPDTKPAPRVAHRPRHRMAGSHDGLTITEHHRGRRGK